MSVRPSAGSPGESSATNPLAGASRPAPALVAFLRGAERRGAVLAELQCGDAEAGDAALARAMRGFIGGAARWPMEQWPGRFWAGLLAEPALHHRAPVALELDATDALAQLGAGPRAAILLRLAAGLEEVDAAAVLGIAVPSYRVALQRALSPSRTGGADAAIDAQGWQRLREQIHRRIKTLPPPRLVRLAGAREAALAGAAEPGGVRVGDGSPAAARPRWLLPLLWVLLALCALAYAATFWPPVAALLGGTGAGRGGEPTLPVEAPAARYGAVAGLVAHRVFELLADPQMLADAEHLGFHAWLATQDLDAAVAGDDPSSLGGADGSR